jgi:hypothetical protein
LSPFGGGVFQFLRITNVPSVPMRMLCTLLHSHIGNSGRTTLQKYTVILLKRKTE